MYGFLYDRSIFKHNIFAFLKISFPFYLPKTCNNIGKNADISKLVIILSVIKTIDIEKARCEKKRLTKFELWMQCCDDRKQHGVHFFVGLYSTENGAIFRTIYFKSEKRAHGTA